VASPLRKCYHTLAPPLPCSHLTTSCCTDTSAAAAAAAAVAARVMACGALVTRPHLALPDACKQQVVKGMGADGRRWLFEQAAVTEHCCAVMNTQILDRSQQTHTCCPALA
jgi:hypothetical protein